MFRYQHRLKSGGVVTVVDWATSTPAIWSDLVETAVDIGLGPLEIASTKFDDAQIDSLRRFGFEPLVESNGKTQRPVGILIQPLTEADDAKLTIGGRSIFGEDNWDVRMIYSDRY